MSGEEILVVRTLGEAREHHNSGMVVVSAFQLPTYLDGRLLSAVYFSDSAEESPFWDKLAATLRRALIKAGH